MTKQKNYLAMLCCLLMAVSCSDDPSYKKLSDLSPFAQEFMSLRMNARLSSDQANAVQQNQFRAVLEQQAFVNGRVKGDSTAGDSTGYDPWVWVTCATVTNTQDELGGQKTVIDYGDGCEEGWDNWKYWMRGKLTYYFRNTETHEGSLKHYNYVSTMAYDNYGGKQYYGGTDTVAWSADGSGHYTGYATFDESANTYSGGYSNSDSLSYTYDGVETLYKNTSESTFDQHRWILSQSDYEYTYGDDYYHATVLSPLVWSYNCQQWVTDGSFNSASDDYMGSVFTYVSGKEVIIYNQGGKEGSFTIDYGDGECDNIIYITENGETARVDLGDYWRVGIYD
jgi:hypothetical protein